MRYIRTDERRNSFVTTHGVSSRMVLSQRETRGVTRQGPNLEWATQGALSGGDGPCYRNPPNHPPNTRASLHSLAAAPVSPQPPNLTPNPTPCRLAIQSAPPAARACGSPQQLTYYSDSHCVHSTQCIMLRFSRSTSSQFWFEGRY